MPGYLHFGYFDLSLIPAAPSGSPPDLLAAAIALFKATSSLTTVFTGGIVSGLADPKDVVYPYVQIESEDDVEPGESIEDKAIDLTFTVWANDEDSVKSLGRLLMSVYDSPATNPSSSREPLTYTTGSETFNWRETNKPRRAKGLGTGSKLVWRWVIPYRFWVNEQGVL